MFEKQWIRGVDYGENFYTGDTVKMILGLLSRSGASSFFYKDPGSKYF